MGVTIAIGLICLYGLGYLAYTVAKNAKASNVA